MSVSQKKSLLENLIVVVLISVLAGTAGGLAVGFITRQVTSTTSAAR